MQLQTHRTHFGFHKHRYRNKLQKVSPSVDVKYSNITQALKTILKEEGIRVRALSFVSKLFFA